MPVTSVLGAFLELERGDPDVPVVMEKRLGLWKQRTRTEVVDQVAAIADGLASLQVGPGEAVLLAASEHADWLALDLAVQALGAAVCPVPADATRDELRHALAVSGARVVIVDDQEQADLVLDLADDGANVDHVVDVDPSGLHGHQDPRLMTLPAPRGSDERVGARESLAVRVGDLRADAVAVRALTSGTNGQRRIVDLTHGALLAGTQAVIAATELDSNDRVLSFRPLADPAERTTTIGASLLSGALLALPESRMQVAGAMYEVAPTYVHLTRRWIDRTTSQVIDRLQTSSGIKGLFGRRWVRRVESGGGASSSKGLAVRYPVLEKLGLDKARLVVVSGSPLGSAERAFTAALGLPVRDAYALAEAGGLVTLAQGGDAEGLGRPLDHVQVRTDVSGQIVVSGPAVGDVELATGDRGEMVDGQLVLGGRMDDHVTIGGASVDLAEAEVALRSSPYVREAVLAVVDGRTLVVAELAEEPLERWATRQGITFATFRALTTTDEVKQLLRSELEPLVAEAGVSRIDEIRPLPTSLEQVEGVLTASGRVRRSVVVATTAPGGSPVDAGVA